MGVTKYLFFVLILSLVFSCQNRRDTQSQVGTEDESGMDKLEEIQDVFYRIPSPDEMLNIIDKEKLAFNDALPLSIERAGRYLDSRSQALNLGVYIADLAYITLFQRQKEALIYFQVVYGLSDKLRISSAFHPAMLKRFENNLGNIDSLRLLSDEALIEITNYLVRNNKEKVMALISIGGFIESLYLAFHIVDDHSDDIIIQRICDQKLVLENLMNYANEYADDENIASAIRLIQPVRKIYNELVITQEETQIIKSADGRLIIKGGDRINITKDQFEHLREATLSARKSITENLEN